MDRRKNVLDELSITVLIEDYAGYDSGLLAQHGVSYLVEAKSGKHESKILFDTGQSAAPLLNNASLLGVNPCEIDYVVLSHCHYDHTGGLVEFLEAAGSERLPVIAHSTLFRPNFSSKPTFRSNGMPPLNNREAIVNAGGDLILADEPISLMPGVITSGEIIDKVEYEEEMTLSSFTLEHGRVIADRMADELALYFSLPQGLVILTGCSHPGIISIIEKAKILTKIETIAAVIGGFHLVSASEPRIAKTAEALKLAGCDVYTGHCTGLKAESELLNQLSNRFYKLRTGLRIKLS
jgi:7,8-dihydropterin-6-yl-methyl-4-(beta-D-ribofuranosyl)aminobenzene 5'-phosphate synthase